MHYFLSKYNFYVPYQSDSRVFLLFNTRTSNLCALNKDVFEELKVLNKEHKTTFSLDELKMPSDIASVLIKNGFILTEDTDELAILKSVLLKGRYETTMISLVIAPTMACNFMCSYCFEPKEARNNAKPVMSIEVQDAIINYVKDQFTKYKIHSIVVDWYGGEPTLAMGVIERVSSKLIDLAKDFGAHYQAYIVTNGYLLTPNVVDKLAALKISCPQITLDGPKEVHDSRRMSESGAGTYDTIIKNLSYVAEKLGQIVLRMNVNKANYNAPAELYEELKDKDFFDKIVFSLGNVFCNGKGEINQVQFTKYFIDFLTKRGENISSFLPTPKSNYCAADAVWAKMIGPFGELYRCWEEFGNPNKVVGNLLTNKLNKLHYEYITSTPFENESCTKCSFLPACMGGCPKFAIENSDKKYRMCDTKKHLMHKIISQYVNEQFSEEGDSVSCQDVNKEEVYETIKQ
jgi:uncharacterized protein